MGDCIYLLQSFAIQPPSRQHPVHNPHSAPTAITYSALPDYANPQAHPISNFGTPATPSFQPSHHAIAGQYGLYHTPHEYERQTLFLPRQDHYNNLHRRDKRAEGQISRSALLEDFRLNIARKKWVLQVGALSCVSVQRLTLEPGHLR